MSAKKVTVILIHTFVGWTLSAVTTGVGVTVTTLDNALVLHTIGAPLFFTLVSLLYVNKIDYTEPFQTAAMVN